MRKNIRLTLIAMIVAVAGQAGANPDSAAQTGLADAQEKHLGVASCSGSTCHGAIRPWQVSPILQNEYVTWSREDAHARAYKVLFNQRSKRIARNLGLKTAHEAAECLDCHADNVPADLRGERFQISDGVGCESCHGGAERWLKSHTAEGNSHQDNLQAGMYPAENPEQRATLCLSCHFGDSRKFVTHRMMGAGHPRMSFELDTFTAVQPAHYRIDADYRERKQTWSGLQVWAVGQAVAVRVYLDALLDPEIGRDGLFPELVLFDCHACHHRMSNQRWEPGAGTGLPPGVVRLNDSGFLMLRHIVMRIDPGLTERLRRELRQLHGAVTRGNRAMRQAAKRLHTTVSGLIPRIAGYRFADTDLAAILGGLIHEGLGGKFRDYAAAEQVTMAVANVIAVMERTGTIDKPGLERVNRALAQMYSATENDEEYSAHRFATALRTLREAAPGS